MSYLIREMLDSVHDIIQEKCLYLILVYSSNLLTELKLLGSETHEMCQKYVAAALENCQGIISKHEKIVFLFKIDFNLVFLSNQYWES